MDQRSIHRPQTTRKIHGRQAKKGSTACGPEKDPWPTGSVARRPKEGSKAKRPERDPWPRGQDRVHGLAANQGSIAYGPRRDPKPLGQGRQDLWAGTRSMADEPIQEP